ncbi:MAG: thioredoxin domain-containing protein, partial [Bdellovibrionota bacterium]
SSPLPPSNKWAKPLGAAEGKKANRLIHSTSPYLLQHAYNPVDWSPWDEEALERAKKEDKPIFLSIGYSACHWCHVMEHESFEDEEVAKLLNANFIPIKVDREERPDLDAIYMTAVQIMTQSGGWPMSVFLTPDLKPFFGGTYFPKEDKFGRPGFIRVLHALADAYKNERGKVAENAERLIEAVRESAGRGLEGATPPFEAALKNAADQLRSQLDPDWGGFGRAPKFPRTLAIELLLRAHQRTGQERYLEAATLTLDKMALGGMYDHLGGGFHRYSVDDEWLVPHFEKMLYDNALLATSYLQAWQVTRKPFYQRVVEETLGFVLRDMTDPATGAFYSTLDADSEGEEGKFYVWKPGELKDVLGETEWGEFARIYGVTLRGNFEHGTSILHLVEPLETVFDEAKRETIRRQREKLFNARLGRIHPLRDDKVLTSWNALMVSALAQGGFALKDAKYLAAARRGADFLLTTMRAPDGALLHTYREGKAHTSGYLEDHAFLLAALLDLYEASFEMKWLEEAKKIAELLVGNFWDEAGAGFFSTDGKDPSVLVRTKELFDGATPSPSGVAAYALARLSVYTGDKALAEKAEKTVKANGKAIDRAGSAVASLFFTYEMLAGSPKEIALVGRSNTEEIEPFLEKLRGRFLPGRALSILLKETADGGSSKLPLLAYKELVGGRAAAYVCKGYACERPVTEAGEFDKLLTGGTP